MTYEEQKQELVRLIDKSEHIVFFGGAGVSTESGIPDFRSKDGLYNQHDVQFDAYSPEYLLSHTCLYHNPKIFFEFYRQKLDGRGVEPNITHIVLAELEKLGKNIDIVTQNIDGLHQKAGSTRVHEIHGTTQRTYCTKCKMEYHPDYIFNSKDAIPRCECGGMIRPDITLYEENLPNKAVNDAVEAISKADLLIIAGTSLTVYPANTFVSYFSGDCIVVVNRDMIDTQNMLFGMDDIFIQSNMGDVFQTVYNELVLKK